MQLAAVVCVCGTVTGCRHKSKAPTTPPLPPPAQVALEPAPSTPLQVQPVPVTPLPTLPAKPQPKKKKRKPVVVTPANAPPVELASNTPPPPPVNVVGSLTAGGDAAAAAQQKAAGAIGDVEKQLTGISAATLEAQKDGVARVKNFLRQAHDALKSGDAEGALTLAGKAKVLLDDLLK
jgi:hypothetical protein